MFNPEGFRAADHIARERGDRLTKQSDLRVTDVTATELGAIWIDSGGEKLS
jgi:hypothetical protein